MTKKKLNFCFKGSRDYIHGTDIFNELKNCFNDSLNYENTMLDLSFHGIAKKKLDIVEDNATDAKVVVKFYDTNDDKKTYYLVENKDDIVCRYDYAENKIVELSKIDLDLGKINLNKDTSYSLIENIVALNKSLLENMFKEAFGKWYFTRLQLKKIPLNYYLIRLEFKSNFNFKLTKTEIFLDNESLGFIYFSLV
ncbi:hypothetical protein [Francisella orientalis]|uniref:dTDP-glucose 4,6-dehydratase n=1 Tax=Francisella orientalis TaxID=299583 RepID=A0AAP7KJC9_9GAMM|nr:hypothetical protein [Francisella orientalis]AFJ43282.1 dTDP-glucose 4,6-dehydratase [Francisella orientalis str. Toba 04]AHB99289.1 hypothetical protein M973_08290 [Francisella orientalis LADL 07-285A]AKN86052.1 dTDP-glucose 4,6-dehydratase [Francisella orientalis FNO12]AKN87590.1 dTDP-glucose 4,6-dehydratase [Francisella orientalis FNO24]AKN89128.1 dTDP-glucose 4,6-dehydratase [Francisella orientalis]